MGCCCIGGRGKQNVDYQNKPKISCEEAVTKLSETRKNFNLKYNIGDVILFLFLRKTIIMHQMVYW